MLLILEKQEPEATKIRVKDQGRLWPEIAIEEPLSPRLTELPAVNCLVGREGGWTETEEKQANDNRFEAVSLGNQVLRCETAAVAAFSPVGHFWNV